MEPLNLFSSSIDTTQPLNVQWVLEKPLIELIKQGFKSLKDILKKVREYIRYEERMPDFSIQDVIDRIGITQNIEIKEGMSQEEIMGIQLNIMERNTWTTTLWEILDIAIQWKNYNTRVNQDSIDMMMGKPYIEASWEGKTDLNCQIPLNYFVPGVLHVSRNIVKIELDVKVNLETAGNRVGRIYNLTMVPTLLGEKRYPRQEGLGVDSKHMCTNTLMQENLLVADEMNIVIWNARGAGYLECINNLLELKKFLSLKIIIIVETRQSVQESMTTIKSLGYTGHFIVGAGIYAEGIWFLWNDNLVSISGAVQSITAIHAVITMKPRGEPSMLSAIYEDQHKHERKQLWKEFNALDQIQNVGWMFVGDFNFIKDPTEKMEGKVPSYVQLQ